MKESPVVESIFPSICDGTVKHILPFSCFVERQTLEWTSFVNCATVFVHSTGGGTPVMMLHYVDPIEFYTYDIMNIISSMNWFLRRKAVKFSLLVFLQYFSLLFIFNWWIIKYLSSGCSFHNKNVVWFCHKIFQHLPGFWWLLHKLQFLFVLVAIWEEGRGRVGYHWHAHIFSKCITLHRITPSQQLSPGK